MIFTWNMDPVLFHLGPIAPRWYGLLFALAFVWAYLVCQKIFHREKIELKYLDSLLNYIVLGTVIGARVGHCLFYEPEFYLSHPLKILAVWEGGLASHGAVIGIATATYLYHKKFGNIVSLSWLFDRLAIVIPISGASIRIGNFFNSEILGKATNSNWGIVFQRIDNIPRHPAQLYEAAVYLLLALSLWIFYLKGWSKFKGFQIGFMFVIMFTARFFLEFIKENQEDFEAGMLLNMGQLLSLPLIALGFFLIFRSRRNA